MKKHYPNYGPNVNTKFSISTSPKSSFFRSFRHTLFGASKQVMDLPLNDVGRHDHKTISNDFVLQMEKETFFTIIKFWIYHFSTKTIISFHFSTLPCLIFILVNCSGAKTISIHDTKPNSVVPSIK